MIPTWDGRVSDVSEVASCNPGGIAVRFRLDIRRFASVNVIGQGRAELREARATPMWQNLSLRGRINLLLALLLALGLAVNIGRQVNFCLGYMQEGKEITARLFSCFLRVQYIIGPGGYLCRILVMRT